MIKGEAVVIAVRKEGQGGDPARRELLRRMYQQQMGNKDRVSLIHYTGALSSKVDVLMTWSDRFVVLKTRQLVSCISSSQKAKMF